MQRFAGRRRKTPVVLIRPKLVPVDVFASKGRLTLAWKPLITQRRLSELQLLQRTGDHQNTTSPIGLEFLHDLSADLNLAQALGWLYLARPIAHRSRLA